MSNNAEPLPPLYPMLYEETVRQALAEDLGRGGDTTTDAIVSPQATATALIVARAPGRIAGIDLAACAFHSLDATLKFDIQLPDGKDAGAGEILARVYGRARPILSAERTALNFLARLSGIATATRDIIAQISPYPARIVCTRKTTPGLRTLEKYAVRAGGGTNHRFGLDDAALIKDNHLLMAGSVAEAVRRVRGRVGHLIKIEVEVLLDNMSVSALAEAVRMVQGKAITEASGGITLETAADVAATGVDLISVGCITHSAPADPRQKPGPAGHHCQRPRGRL